MSSAENEANETMIPPPVQQREATVRYSESLWQSLSDAAGRFKKLPSFPDLTENLRQVPSFTTTRHKAAPKGLLLLAKASITWSTTDKHGCMQYSNLIEDDSDVARGYEYFDLAKTKVLEQGFIVGIKDAKTCVIDQNHKWKTWPGEEGEGEPMGENNFLAALTLAWAYILSSIWAESQGGELVYTDEMAPTGLGNPVNRGLTVCTKDQAAARWWAAVLAPRQGWRAFVIVDDTTYQSPWAVSLNGESMFSIEGSPPLGDTICAGSSQSFAYFSDFCRRHNLMSQEKAALGAALAFPSHTQLRFPLSLPAPNHTHPVLNGAEEVQPPDLANTFQVLPNLMTISVTIQGFTSIVSSIFYEESIPCNLCSKWLEPMLSIIRSVPDIRHLATMGIRRKPSMGGWWLGSTITGLDRKILEEVGSGTPAVNLPSWWWTQAPQSYLCSPSPGPREDSTIFVSRHKEVILLYLSQQAWTNTPPWNPPGKTPIEGTHVVVQKHANCAGHGLSYHSWSWIRSDGSTMIDLGYSSPENVPIVSQHPKLSVHTNPVNLEIISQNASMQCTRMLFWWLGQEGIAANDRLLFQSLEKWIGMAVDDEDSDESDSDNGTSDEGKSTRVEGVEHWLKT